jgi:hypothetical protein
MNLNTAIKSHYQVQPLSTNLSQSVISKIRQRKTSKWFVQTPILDQKVMYVALLAVILLSYQTANPYMLATLIIPLLLSITGQREIAFQKKRSLKIYQISIQ